MAQAESGVDLRRVARVADVPPGGMVAAALDGRPIAVANLGDEIVAFQNACLHAHVRLSEGMLDGDVVTCRWHQWQYCVRTGDVLTDESPWGTFTTFTVHVEGDDILVETGPRTRITVRPETAADD